MSALSRIIFDADVTAPGVPVISSVSALSSSSLRISWSSVSDNVNGTGLGGYAIYRSAALAGTYTLIQTVSPASTSYDDTGLTSGTQYFYKVAAFDRANPVNTSAQSSASSGTTSSSGLPLIYGTDFEGMTAGAAPSGSFFTFQNSGGSAFIHVDNSTLMGGTKNLLAHYTTDASENEQDYTLPGGPYTRVTFEFDYWIPSNYSHGPSTEGGPTNNKGMRISPVTPASGGGNRLGYSFVRNADGTSSDLVLEWDDLDHLHGGDFTQMWFDAAGHQFIGPADLGKAMHLKIAMVAATARHTGKGDFKIYKNGVLIADAQPDNFVPDDPANWLYGYFWGYANSRFTVTTDLRMDNLQVSAQ